MTADQVVLSDLLLVFVVLVVDLVDFVVGRVIIVVEVRVVCCTMGVDVL